mgnify:CR=1 FL=1
MRRLSEFATGHDTSYQLGFDLSFGNFDFVTMTELYPIIRDSIEVCIGGEFSTFCPVASEALGHWQLVLEPSADPLMLGFPRCYGEDT